MSTPKHSREQLRAMAQQFLAMRDTNPVQCRLLLLQLSLRTGLSQAACEMGIAKLAA